MLELYRTKNENLYEKVKSLLKSDGEIARTPNGKPYIDGCNFSVTHTGDTALIAISDKPVGIDAEIIKERNFSSVLMRFTLREQDEINGDTVTFLKNWVIKEAYIKMLGGTLAHDLKRLECIGGELFCDEAKINCNILCSSSNGLIFAVCSNGEIPQNIKIKNI